MIFSRYCAWRLGTDCFCVLIGCFNIQINHFDREKRLGYVECWIFSVFSSALFTCFYSNNKQVCHLKITFKAVFRLGDARIQKKGISSCIFCRDHQFSIRKSRGILSVNVSRRRFLGCFPFLPAQRLFYGYSFSCSRCQMRQSGACTILYGYAIRGFRLVFTCHKRAVEEILKMDFHCVAIVWNLKCFPLRRVKFKWTIRR